jgi:c-di-GMP-binding flagellar brake protein YcgR
VEERRENPRFACDLAAAICVDDGAPSPRRVVDISRGGISMVGDDPVAIRTHVSIELAATTDDGETEAVAIGATIMWCSKTKDETYQLGAKFDEAKGRERSRRFDRLLELLCPPA